MSVLECVKLNVWGAWSDSHQLYLAAPNPQNVAKVGVRYCLTGPDRKYMYKITPCARFMSSLHIRSVRLMVSNKLMLCPPVS